MNSTKTTLPFIASLPAWLYIQIMGRTNRIQIEGPDFYTLLQQGKGPFLYALWHSRVMIPIYHFQNKPIAVIVSQSKDGEYITQVMKRFRLHATRGSATRHGAEGLLGLAHWLHRGKSAVITPDGPRGPRERVQPGIVRLSKLSGIPIVPICFSCTHNLRFASWDRFMLPLPFGTIHMASSDPIVVSHHAGKEELEEKRLILEREMERVTRIADQRAGVEMLPSVDCNTSS